MKRVLLLAFIGLAVCGCSSELSEEELDTNTRGALLAINKELIKRLGGGEDSIRSVKNASLLDAYNRYCKFEDDLPKLQSAWGICTLYDPKAGVINRVVDLELYRFANANDAAFVHHTLTLKVEELRKLKPGQYFCVSRPVQRVHQVYYDRTLVLAVNIQGRYSEKELAVIDEVLSNELYKHR